MNSVLQLKRNEPNTHAAHINPCSFHDVPLLLIITRLNAMLLLGVLNTEASMFMKEECRSIAGVEMNYITVAMYNS